MVFTSLSSRLKSQISVHFACFPICIVIECPSLISLAIAHRLTLGPAYWKSEFSCSVGWNNQVRPLLCLSLIHLNVASSFSVLLTVLTLESKIPTVAHLDCTPNPGCILCYADAESYATVSGFVHQQNTDLLLCTT